MKHSLSLLLAMNIWIIFSLGLILCTGCYAYYIFLCTNSCFPFGYILRVEVLGHKVWVCSNRVSTN